MPAPVMFEDGGAWLKDPALKEHATATQIRYIDAVLEHKTMRAASRALGVAISCISTTLRRARENAARYGHAPGHFNDGTAPGYRMGKVTVQRGSGGIVERVWERQHPDDALREEMFLARVEGLKDELPRAMPIAAPAICDSDLLTIYPQGDPHAGLYSWIEETGSHFDLEEFERINRAAIDQLVASAPASETAVDLDLGDSTHADNSKNRTPKSNHELDVDGKHSQVVRVAMRLKRYRIARMLEKHRSVVVRVNRGNHDGETAMMLALMLEAIYENEPRVSVDISPNPYWYLGFGSNLIGSTHGDGAKGKDLPLLMACDQPHAWAASQHGSRIWFVGHVHHKDIKDYPGVTVEYTRTLAAQDAWSHGAGFRSKRTMEAVTLHRTDGEIARVTVGLPQINRVAA